MPQLWLPPPEIIKRGNEAILNYFEDIKSQGIDYLYEAKMLIIGKRGVGKTSLVRKLLNRSTNLPEEKEINKGIDIETLSFECSQYQNKVVILPALLEDCKIPILLQDKKYANFKDDYQQGFDDLLLAIS